MRKAIITALALTLAACSTAGPFVSEIYQDGNQISVKKCSVRFNSLAGFAGRINKTNCTTEQVKPLPAETATR